MDLVDDQAKMRLKLNEISRKIHTSRTSKGALTSKPYAFVARPWELTSINAIDNFGSLGANIQLQTRGNELMRILPRTNDEINDDWIDDKTRFSYDGLKTQRLIKPLCRDPQNIRKWDKNTNTWRDVFRRISTAYDELKESDSSLSIRALVGPFADIQSVLALSDFTELLTKTTNKYCVETTGSKVLPVNGIPSTYRFNTSLRGVEEADLCLLVGTNFMVEDPLYSTRLFKAFKGDEIRYSQLGFNNNLVFPSEQIGLTPKVLAEIESEQHPYFKTLKEAEKPMFIMDSSIFDRADGEAIARTVLNIAKKTNLQKVTESGELYWNGLNIYHKNANDVGINELGRVKSLGSLDEKSNFLYLLNVQCEDLPNGVKDVEKLRKNNKFIIYQGSHGDELASIADIVLPGAVFSEKNGTYTNVEGRAQYSNRALTPPGIGKNDWLILRGLSEVLGKPLPYSNEEELQARLELLVPNTSSDNLGKIVNAFFQIDNVEKLLSSDSEIENTPFVPAKSDFFIPGHPASKVSKVMAMCSKDNYELFKNFADY